MKITKLETETMARSPFISYSLSGQSQNKSNNANEFLSKTIFVEQYDVNINNVVEPYF